MNDYYYMNRDFDGYAEEPNGGFDLWAILAIIAAAFMLMGMITSCKTKTQIVTVPEYHTEYIVRSDTIARTDSVLIKDSVYVYHMGDTIIINKVAYRDKVRNVYKVRTDTLLRRDSVRVPYPVEAQLSKAQQRYIAVGRFAVRGAAVVLAAIVLSLVVCLARRYLKKE